MAQAWQDKMGIPMKATIVTQTNYSDEEKKKMEDYHFHSSEDQKEDFDPFLDTPTDHWVNQSTGEVLVLDKEDQEITLYRGQSEPEYLTRLKALTIPLEDKLALLSLYEGTENTRTFKSMINKEVDIYGAIVWEHPPYKAKTAKDDDPLSPGYNQIKLLAMDGEGNPLIIVASHGALANHLYAILALRGWYLWDSPVRYMLGQDEKTNGFRLTNASRVKAMLINKKVGSVTLVEHK